MRNAKILPLIIAEHQIAQTDCFTIENALVRFSNRTERWLERIHSRSGPTVLIVPMLDPRTVLLVREYCPGTHSYEIAFPTGTVKAGESVEETANRELKEEAGFGIGRISPLMTVKVFPGHFDHETHLVLAEDLYPERLPGDEPEEIEVVRWPVSSLQALRDDGQVREARSVAALLLLENRLRSGSGAPT